MAQDDTPTRGSKPYRSFLATYNSLTYDLYGWLYISGQAASRYRPEKANLCIPPSDSTSFFSLRFVRIPNLHGSTPVMQKRQAGKSHRTSSSLTAQHKHALTVRG